MDKILIVAGLSSSLKNFRGDLIKSWLSKGYGVVAAAPGFEAKPWLEKLGVKYYNIPLSRTGLNPLEDINLTIKLKQIIKNEKPDHLFLYTIKSVIYGSLAAYFYKKCKVFSLITGLGYIFTAGLQQKPLLQRIVSWLYRIALRRNSKVFFQNPDDIDAFKKLNIIAADKAFLINGSGVNLDYYRQANLPAETITFLMIARFLTEKGICEYIEAAGLVKAKYPEIVFKLIGWQLEGGPSVISADQTARWKEDGVVEIIAKTEDVRPYIAASSVYVLPSYREGTPRTVLEAMAMGRAIITTDAPGCRETVIDTVNGFLVPVKNSTALAEAMQRFITDPKLAVLMGAESRRIAEEKYDVRKVNRIINEVMGLL
jgi:glycosyltransferase involved in cell wall biosynthesis